MDNQQQQRINKAAQQFTDALVGAYRATSNRTVAAQDLGVQLTGHFFTSVINNLRIQAEGTQQVTQQLADQQRRAQVAARKFTQASAGTYIDLLDSIFSFYQGGTTRAKMLEEADRRAEEAESRAEQAESLTEEAQRRAEQAEKRTEEVERSTRKAEGRAKKAEERTEEAESRAEQAERNTEEAQGRTEEAEGRAEEAQGRTEKAEERAKEAERRAEEAERQVEQAQGRAEQSERRTEKAEERAEEAQRRAEQAERRSSEAERAESTGDDDLPLADYDSLNIRQISERLDELSVEEIRRLRDYEARNKNRSTLVNRLDSRIDSSSSQ
jgi:chromosome segregation ATPase